MDSPEYLPAEDSPGLLHDLRARILAVALVPMIFVVVVLVGYFAHREISSAEQAQYERGRAIAQRLAETAAFDLFVGNDPTLERFLSYERASQGCESVAIADLSGRWRLVSGRRGLPIPTGSNDAREWRAGDHAYFVAPVLFSPSTVDDPYVGEDGGRPSNIGEVMVVLDMGHVIQAKRESVLLVIGLASLFLLVAAGLVWRLSQGLSQPLHAITAAVRAIAGGHLDARVRAQARGEIGELVRGINGMAEVMQRNAQEMEQRVSDATVELRDQKAAAEAAVMARSRFLAAASHDLRQPMHALTLLIEALKEKIRPQDGEPLRLVEHIEASAHSMEALLNALLDLSKLDAGVVVARLECFKVALVFERLARQFGPLAAEKGLSLRIHGGKVAVYTDPVLLERILGNLLANAIRYTDAGRIILGTRRVQKDWVRFEVLDSGKGIPEAFRERIFEEYFQLENPERDRDKGLGLGLSIVQRLARLLGSPVEVRSELGRGSSFSIRTVRCELPEGQLEREVESLDVPPPDDDRMPLVVFIDDDESILEAMAAVFEQWGIDLAADVEARAIKEDLLELGRRPDAILSDYRLRDGLTGIEAIAELRAAFGPDIPAALITGDTAATTMQVINATGLPVLHKPLKPATLRAYLHHMLASSQGSHPEGR